MIEVWRHNIHSAELKTPAMVSNPGISSLSFLFILIAFILTLVERELLHGNMSVYIGSQLKTCFTFANFMHDTSCHDTAMNTNLCSIIFLLTVVHVR